MYKLLEQYIKGITEIDETNLKLVLNKFKLIKTPRHQILVDYNQICKHHYFVNKGAVRVYTLNKDGLENIVWLKTHYPHYLKSVSNKIEKFNFNPDAMFIYKFSIRTSTCLSFI